MKQHYATSAQIDVHTVSSNSMRAQVEEMAWVRIKELLGKVELPRGWQRNYAAQSLTFKSPTGVFCIKITTDMRVFIDRKLKGGYNFRSTQDKCTSFEAAASIVIDTLDTFLKRSAA